MEDNPVSAGNDVSLWRLFRVFGAGGLAEGGELGV